MNVYKGRLLKKIFKSKIEARLVNAGHYMAFKHRISFACKLWLLSIQNDARHRFQAFANRHLKSLCCSIQIWADALSSHKLSTLEKCCFVPMSYFYSETYFFYSETYDWSKDWAKRWALLWSATTSRQFHRKFHVTWKIILIHLACFAINIISNFFPQCHPSWFPTGEHFRIPGACFKTLYSWSNCIFSWNPFHPL